MTKAQENAIARIRKLVDEECGIRYEIKQWEVEDYEHFISVYVVYGMPNDEGTMAAIFARDHAHLYVGKRGGISFPVHGKRGGHYCLPFHGYSILEAVVKQY